MYPASFIRAQRGCSIPQRDIVDRLDVLQRGCTEGGDQRLHLPGIAPAAFFSEEGAEGRKGQGLIKTR